MPLVTIDTDRLPEDLRTSAALRDAAEWHRGNGRDADAELCRLLADAMPIPLPTTPGSQVRCDGAEWTLFVGDLWQTHTSDRARYTDELAALGPFEVIRDAGVA